MEVAEYLSQLGNRARSLRRLRKMSQAEMARRASLSLRSYQAFESGGSIQLRTLANILVVLECERDLDRLIKPTPSFQSLDEFEKMPPSAITEVV
jgi:transcriptional regulator with XRE-family HTH domain